MAQNLPEDEALLDVIDLALQHGPSSLAELANAVMEAFPDVWVPGDDSAEVEDLLDSLLMDYAGYWNRGGELVASTPMMRRGSVATIRLTGAHIESDGVDLDEATLLLDLLIPVKVAGIGDYDLDDNSDLLVGPTGWLADASVGDILALSFDGTQLQHEIIAESDLADDTAILSWLREERDRLAEAGRGTDDFILALECRMSLWDAEARPFSQPVRPLSELFAAAGLEFRAGEVGPAGIGWTSTSDAALARSIRELADQLGFGPCCDQALEEVMVVLERLADASPTLVQLSEAELESVADALTHSYVGTAVVNLFCRHRTKAPAMARLGEQLRPPDLSTVARAAGAFFAGVDEELHGDGVTSEAALQQAIQLQPDFLSAKELLASCAVDRGDIAGAIRFCADLEPDSDPLALLLAYRERRELRYRGVKRNDSCPCGSGRRFKQCCQRHPVVSLQDQIDDLSFALVLAAERPHRAFELQMAEMVGRHSLMSDHLEPFDAVVIEGGLLADYLERRGSLLTDARRELAQLLVANGRSVHRIIEPADAQGRVRIEPLGGGPLFSFPYASPAHVGQLLLGHFCVVDDELAAMGLVSAFDSDLEDELVSGLAEHDQPSDVLRWLDGLLARNVLRLPDGEARMMLIGTMEVSDVPAFETWLGAPALESPAAWSVDAVFDRSLANPPMVHRATDGSFAVTLPSVSSRERFLQDLSKEGIDVEIDWSIETPATLGFVTQQAQEAADEHDDWDDEDGWDDDWYDDPGPALRLP